jgi:TetR/AcrR family transcriptional repressor of mexJK operon
MVSRSEDVAPSRDDVKEQHLLAAAREAFMELGYAATSMDEVAKRARASKTTLYSRFPSKEALFSAAISAECARQMPMDASELAGLPVEEALRRIGRRFVDLIFSEAAMRVERIVTGEAANFPEVAEAFYRSGPQRVTNAVADYFAGATARGELALADPLFAAGQFLMGLKGKAHCEMSLCRCPPPTPEERDEMVAKTVELFLNGARPR